MSLIINDLIYVLLGIFTGLMSGLLGIGGGVIIVPALLFIFSQNSIFPSTYLMQFASGTSLAVMLFTALSALRTHYKLGTILWGEYRRLLPGIVIGTFSGATLADKLPTSWLKIVFGLFLLFVATEMLTGVPERPRRSPSRRINGLVSFLIGSQAGLLGGGGGVIVIPYLSYYGLKMREIAGVSALCSMTVAICGTVVFTLLGSMQTYTVPDAFGYIYWPAVFWVTLSSVFFAQVGAKLSYVLPVKQVRYVFVVLLLMTAFELLIRK